MKERPALPKKKHISTRAASTNTITPRAFYLNELTPIWQADISEADMLRVF